jgi:hypothetical protein
MGYVAGNCYLKPDKKWLFVGFGAIFSDVFCGQIVVFVVKKGDSGGGDSEWVYYGTKNGLSLL